MIYYKIKLKDNWGTSNTMYGGYLIGALPLKFCGKTFIAIKHPNKTGLFRFWERKSNNRSDNGDWTAIPTWIENIVELP